MQEFYIRNETDTDARGPFNLEQLTSLAEAGQVTGETLYYDAVAEQWTTIGGKAELMAQLFPEKKKLKVRPKETFKTLNPEVADAKPIEVTDMLAAAEGRTADTKDKGDAMEAQARAAKLGMYAATAMLLISAVGFLLPVADRIAAADFAGVLAHPLALLGVLDLALFVLLALGTVSLYPFVRFRAALGLGLLGFIFWNQGEVGPMAAAVAGSVGLYFATILTNLAALGPTAALGLLGTAYVTYFLIS